MNRFSAILLLPLFAFGNAFPHATGAAHAYGDPSERPHLHLESVLKGHHEHPHGHHHNHGSNEKERKHGTENPTPVDHDSDAIYLGTNDPFLTTTPIPIDDSGSDCVGRIRDIPGREAITRYYRTALPDPPNRSGPPLFLLHAALRL